MFSCGQQPHGADFMNVTKPIAHPDTFTNLICTFRYCQVSKLQTLPY